MCFRIQNRDKLRQPAATGPRAVRVSSASDLITSEGLPLSSMQVTILDFQDT